MRRIALTAAALVAVQALLAAVYLGAERLRRREEPLRYERESRAAPELAYRTRDGREHRLSQLHGQPVLVHFWATWCPPCVEELPGLLELAESGKLRVLAVSVDPSWAAVEGFLGREPPAAVVLSDGSESADGFRFQSLPQTFLVDAAGRLRLRFSGARDWRSAAMIELLSQES
jgi:thiol-disulfide isomerase/thioredoxin